MKNCSKGIIFLNGDAPPYDFFDAVKLSDYFIICADGAYNHIKPYTMPDIIVGDFDSLDIKLINLPQSVKVVRFPSDKDFTDGYLAVTQAYNNKISELLIVGAQGGRCDHEYNNYTLLALCEEYGIKAKMVLQKFDVYLCGSKFSARVKKGKIISLVPFGGIAHIISTKGLKYAADNLILNKIKPRSGADGISNCSVGEEIEINLRSGKALIFVER